MYPLLQIGRLPAGLSLDWLASSLARRGIGLLPLATFARTEKGFETGRTTFRLTLGGVDGAEVLLAKTRRLLIDLNRLIAEEEAHYNRKPLSFRVLAGRSSRAIELARAWDASPGKSCSLREACAPSPPEAPAPVGSRRCSRNSCSTMRRSGWRSSDPPARPGLHQRRIDARGPERYRRLAGQAPGAGIHEGFPAAPPGGVPAAFLRPDRPSHPDVLPASRDGAGCDRGGVDVQPARCGFPDRHGGAGIVAGIPRPERQHQLASRRRARSCWTWPR